MKTYLKNARLAKGLKTRELAGFLGIDQSLISKFENGSRLPTKEQILKLCQILELPKEELLPMWLKEKVLADLQGELYVEEALQMVQESIGEYKKLNYEKPSTAVEEKLQTIKDLKLKLEELRSFDSYRIAQALELEYTFESNRIEGNTLTLKETDLVINEGITISGKSMREHLEALNHQEAIQYIRDLIHRKINLNERELLSIHNLVLRGIMPENAGVYRRVQVMIKGSSFMPPQPYIVPKLMEELFEWYEKNRLVWHPVLLAAEMHERLVTIHPFIDGNGRTARLIMNLILLSHGYVIANIKGDYETRMAYYHALEDVQVNDNKEGFHAFIADVEIQCLKRYLDILS